MIRPQPTGQSAPNPPGPGQRHRNILIYLSIPSPLELTSVSRQQRLIDDASLSVRISKIYRGISRKKEKLREEIHEFLNSGRKSAFLGWWEHAGMLDGKDKMISACVKLAMVHEKGLRLSL